MKVKYAPTQQDGSRSYEVAVFAMSRSGHTAVMEWIAESFGQKPGWVANQENTIINEGTLAIAPKRVLVVRELSSWLSALIKTRDGKHPVEWFVEFVEAWSTHAVRATLNIDGTVVVPYPTIAMSPMLQTAVLAELGAIQPALWPGRTGTSAFEKRGNDAATVATVDRWSCMRSDGYWDLYKRVLDAVKGVAWDANLRLFRTEMPRLIVEGRVGP